MGDQWNRIRNNLDNQFDVMRSRATSDDQLRRIDEAQGRVNQRVDRAQEDFNKLGNAIGGFFNSSPPPPPPKTSSGGGGLGLLVAGAAVAGGAYLLSKVFGSDDKSKA